MTAYSCKILSWPMGLLLGLGVLFPSLSANAGSDGNVPSRGCPRLIKTAGLEKNAASPAAFGSDQILRVKALIDSPIYSWAVSNPQLVFRKYLSGRPAAEPSEIWEALSPDQVSDTLVRFLEAFLSPEMLKRRAEPEMIERRILVTAGCGVTASEFAQLVGLGQSVIGDPQTRELLAEFIAADVPVRWPEIQKELEARKLFGYRPMPTLVFRIRETRFDEPHENEVEQVGRFGEGLVQRHGELLARFQMLGEILRLKKAWSPMLERIKGLSSNYRAEDIRLLMEQLDTRSVAMGLLLRELEALRAASNALDDRFAEAAATLLVEHDAVEDALKAPELDGHVKIDLEEVKDLYYQRTALFVGLRDSLKIFHHSLNVFAKSVTETSTLMTSLRTKLALSVMATQSRSAPLAEIQKFAERLEGALTLERLP